MFAALSAGVISDKVFKRRRSPVAMFLYFLGRCVILLAAGVNHLRRGRPDAPRHFPRLHVPRPVRPHREVHARNYRQGRALDIGGRKMAGFASGVVDSFNITAPRPRSH